MIPSSEGVQVGGVRSSFGVLVSQPSYLDSFKLTVCRLLGEDLLHSFPIVLI